mmetsp:Transcript_10202/g.23621  ORF Transcript_10202/g.23621 Transcript_10202/m.23621 type:complete len:87 (-) Transcript_10202:2647-2907(-)
MNDICLQPQGLGKYFGNNRGLAVLDRAKYNTMSFVGHSSHLTYFMVPDNPKEICRLVVNNLFFSTIEQKHKPTELLQDGQNELHCR